MYGQTVALQLAGEYGAGSTVYLSCTGNYTLATSANSIWITAIKVAKLTSSRG